MKRKNWCFTTILVEVYICVKDVKSYLQEDIKSKEYKKIEKSLCKECKNKDGMSHNKEMLTDVR